MHILDLVGLCWQRLQSVPGSRANPRRINSSHATGAKCEAFVPKLSNNLPMESKMSAPFAEQKRIVAKLEEILPLCEKLKK